MVKHLAFLVWLTPTLAGAQTTIAGDWLPTQEMLLNPSATSQPRSLFSDAGYVN